MITQMSNGWYMFDKHEVPRIIDALLVAGYKRLPHWFFVHGHHHITLQHSRRGMRILAPPDVWDAYAYSTSTLAMERSSLGDWNV